MSLALQINQVLDKALSGGRLSLAEGLGLMEAPQQAHEDILQAARFLRQQLHGNRVSYVVNRNLNFSNVCDRHCTFCGFMRTEKQDDHYRFSLEECLAKAGETPWVDEFCIQGGIDDFYSESFYGELARGLKREFPKAHLHAFSPEEIHALHLRGGRPIADIIQEFRQAGVDSMPGTAAEVLSDRVRKKVAAKKLSAQEWIETVTIAHKMGHPSTATILFGQIETLAERARHLEILREIQQETGGFSEFVPLLFIPSFTSLGKSLKRDQVIPREEIERFYAVARLFLVWDIPHLQISWVKLGEAFAQEMLSICDDYSGTLYEESITRLAGGTHGTGLSERRIVDSLSEAGFQPWRRETLYKELATPSDDVDRYLGDKWGNVVPEIEGATEALRVS